MVKLSNFGFDTCMSVVCVWYKQDETSLNKHWALKFFTTTLKMNLEFFIIEKTHYVESFENSVDFEINIFDCIWISISSRFHHWIYRFQRIFCSFQSSDFRTDFRDLDPYLIEHP